jgi:hypothetical protein
MSCDKDISVPVGKGNYISVSTSEISSITTNSAKCSFIVNDLNNETVVEQGLCWEITSKPTTANKKMAVTLGTGTFSTNLTNLNPNQTYYVRSYVKLNTGVTMYGDEKYFITKDILPATFRESTITNITATSAQVTGSILDNGGSNLSDVGIVYGYSTNPTIQDIRVSAGASATSFTISLSGLIQNTTYNLRPYAINAKGVLSYGTNVLFQTYSSLATLKNGLVAYYPFNGNANDASGNGNNGIINGAILTSDRNGNANNAFYFDGNNFTRISVPSVPNLNLVNDFSISSWINGTTFRSSSSTVRMILSKSGDNVGSPNGYNYGIWGDESLTNSQVGSINFQALPFNTSATYPKGSSGLIQINSWYNFIVTYSKSTSTLKYYLNNVLIDTKILAFEIGVNNNALWIGSQDSMFTTKKTFEGKIDDIGIWNKVLSAEEIKFLFEKDFKP